MIYDLSSQLDRTSFLERAKYLESKGKGFVELTEKVQRSLNQNAYCHTIIAYFGLQVGCSAQYVKDVYFKREANKEMFVRIVSDPILNTTKETLRSTRDLSKEEMTTAIDRFVRWCSETADIYIPSAEEHKEVVRMQYEVELAKKYL